MNVADRTPNVSYEVHDANFLASGVLLTPATGIVTVGTLVAGGGQPYVPFEAITDPDYYWDLTRNCRPCRPSAPGSFREDRVMAWARTPDKYITFGCTGRWQWWGLDWSAGAYFTLGGGYKLPEDVDRGDLALSIGISDAGDGHVTLTGSLTSSIYGERSVGGGIVGWLIHEPFELFVGMLPEDAAPQLRPYVYSFCNR